MNFEGIIKCTNCGTVNNKTDHCINCGALINPKLKRQESIKRRKKEQENKQRNQAKTQIEMFFERQLKSKNIFIRLFFKFLYGVWITVIAIGAFIAWLFGTIAA